MGQRDQFVVERPLEAVVLVLAVETGDGVRRLGLHEQVGQVDVLRLPPMVDDGAGLELVDPAHHLVDRAEPELGHDLAQVLRHEEEVVDEVLGLAREPLPQLRVLRRDAHRAGVEVTLAQHDAALRHQGGGRDAELVGPEETGDRDVAARLYLAVGLHHDPAAEVVLDEHLLRLGDAKLPRQPGMFDRRLGRCPGASGIAADEHDVSVRLRYPRGDGPDADLGHQLHVDAGARVGVLQVVDQLCQVLDGVDVVVGWGRDQLYPRRGVAYPADVLVHLVARQLSTLARLRPLRHLDLQVGRVDQVVRRDAEPARRHLFDGAVPPVSVRVGGVAAIVLASLAAVAARADAVHRDRE